MPAQVGGTGEVYHNGSQVSSFISSNTYCPRCESVGHSVERCPFPDDAETRRRAAERRERRAHPKPRPERPVDDSPLPQTGMPDAEMRALLAKLSKGKYGRRTLTRRQRLFGELAFCRVKLQRARARRSGYGETWVAFYRDECERLRRCIDAKPRETGKVVYPEIRAEVKGWLLTGEVERMPW